MVVTGTSTCGETMGADADSPTLLEDASIWWTCRDVARRVLGRGPRDDCPVIEAGPANADIRPPGRRRGQPLVKEPTEPDGAGRHTCDSHHCEAPPEPGQDGPGSPRGRATSDAASSRATNGRPRRDSADLRRAMAGMAPQQCEIRWHARVRKSNRRPRLPFARMPGWRSSSPDSVGGGVAPGGRMPVGCPKGRREEAVAVRRSQLLDRAVRATG